MRNNTDHWRARWGRKVGRVGERERSLYLPMLSSLKQQLLLLLLEGQTVVPGATCVLFTNPTARGRADPPMQSPCGERASFHPLPPTRYSVGNDTLPCALT